MAGRLCLTGVVRIEDGDDERLLHGVQPRLILVRTGLEPGHPFTAEALGLLLWPNAAGFSEGALRGVIAKVRSYLGEAGRLDNAGHCYRFLPGEVSVDVEEASHALAEAESARRERRWADAAHAADSAVALLSDPLLPGVDAEWLVPWRTRLERRRARAQRAAARAHSMLGDHDEARDLAESALETDPFDESSHRALMAVLLAGGNRSEALLAYARLRRLLADELGVEPDAETRSLFEHAVERTDPGGVGHD